MRSISARTSSLVWQSSGLLVKAMLFGRNEAWCARSRRRFQPASICGRPRVCQTGNGDCNKGETIMLRMVLATAAVLAGGALAFAAEPAAPSADYGKLVSIIGGCNDCHT